MVLNRVHWEEIVNRGAIYHIAVPYSSYLEIKTWGPSLIKSYLTNENKQAHLLLTSLYFTVPIMRWRFKNLSENKIKTSIVLSFIFWKKKKLTHLKLLVLFLTFHKLFSSILILFLNITLWIISVLLKLRKTDRTFYIYKKNRPTKTCEYIDQNGKYKHICLASINLYK